MSRAAYAVAVRDAIQTLLNLDANSVECGFDGEPKPSAGQFYCAIHPGAWTAPVVGDIELDESVDLYLTLTMRIGTSPQDRWGVAVWLAMDGLEAKARQLGTFLHMNYPVMNQANASIVAGQAPGSDRFHHPLEFRGESAQPTLKGPDWFNAPPPQTDYEIQPCGVSLTLALRGAKRCQATDNGIE